MHWYLSKRGGIATESGQMYIYWHTRFLNGYAKIALSPCEMKMNEDGGRSSGGDARWREAVSVRRTIGPWWGVAAEQWAEQLQLTRPRWIIIYVTCSKRPKRFGISRCLTVFDRWTPRHGWKYIPINIYMSMICLWFLFYVWTHAPRHTTSDKHVQFFVFFEFSYLFYALFHNPYQRAVIKSKYGIFKYCLI